SHDVTSRQGSRTRLQGGEETRPQEHQAAKQRRKGERKTHGAVLRASRTGRTPSRVRRPLPPRGTERARLWAPLRRNEAKLLGSGAASRPPQIRKSITPPPRGGPAHSHQFQIFSHFSGAGAPGPEWCPANAGAGGCPCGPVAATLWEGWQAGTGAG